MVASMSPTPDGPQGRSPVMTFSTVFHELAAILMIAGIIAS
jgi:hypothetical protein